VRAQTSLPAFGVALLLLTAGVVLGISAADTALFSAERPALDRQAAVGLSERLVAASAPLTARANVVNATRVENLTASELSTRYGLAADVGVRVDLDDRTVVSAGDPTGGTTVERIVLVNRRVTRTITPPLADTRAVTLPRRAPNATLRLRPPANTTVRSVRANDRIVLRNTSGLNGTFRIDLSRYRTTTFRLVATGDLPTGSVSITYRPSLTRKAQLAVTVDG
jgi:hypothetical protein